ncbi:MAG: PQQ-like beta-propeller repeat protein [Acidobacteria bacterium]|nr:PQQ-like beta-propeller repeat protein [Acidobacteriota bacterium]
MQSTNAAPVQTSISSRIVLLSSLLFPPLGLMLLWLKRDSQADRKLLASVGIVLFGVVYFGLLARAGAFSIFMSRPPDAESEARYSNLERHRQKQREEMNATTASNPNQPVDAATAATTTSASASPTAATNGSGADNVTTNVWTNYRGSNRDGRYEEQKILTDWPAGGLKPLWKQPIGGGYASFVIANNVAYTIEQRRKQEVVAAYDMQKGRELWTYGWDAEFTESMGGDGPRATPTFDEGKIYALGATGELHCVEAKSGKKIWSKDILTDNGATNLQWGMSAAPLIVDDKVIVQPGGRSGKSIVAYNKNTGAAVWRTLNDAQAYVSPMLMTLANRRQIVAVTATRVVGLNTDNGALLWDYPWATSMGINCSQALAVDASHFFISSGYGKGAALVEVNDNGGKFAASKVWENTSMKNKFNSSVLHNGYAYGLDEGILACVEVATGERKWKGGRYGYGQVILASDHLLITSDTGELALVKATPDSFQEVAKFAALEGKTWNYPAIAKGRLLIRNATEMACFDLAAK